MQKMTLPVRLLLVIAIAALSIVGLAKGATAQGTKIVVAAVKGVESAGIKAVIPDWEKKTGNSVDLIELPYPDLQDKVFTDAQAGTGSYDAIFIDDPWMPFLASNGYLTALDSLGYKVDTDFVQKSLDVASWPP